MSMSWCFFLGGGGGVKYVLLYGLFISVQRISLCSSSYGFSSSKYYIYLPNIYIFQIIYIYKRKRGGGGGGGVL